MTTKAGVWIDHDKAVVVLLTDDGEGVQQILADRGASARLAAGLRPKNAQTQSAFVGEAQREPKATALLNEYYDEIIDCIGEAQAILILGPGEAKGEFRRRIAMKKFRGHVTKMKTVARLTDQQIADYVRQHFQ